MYACIFVFGLMGEPCYAVGPDRQDAGALIHVTASCTTERAINRMSYVTANLIL